MKNISLCKKWAKNQGTINAWLSMPCAFSAELIGKAGFDSVTIDIQHGLISYENALNMFQAMSSSKSELMARVPWLNPSDIMKVLDAGAKGIICPMVNTKEDAQKLVSYSYYPPLGTRSFGPTRAKYFLNDYAKDANSSLLIIAMIETAEALKNLDEILSVEGIDGIYIGPADLSLNLGKEPAFDKEDEFILKTIKHILKEAKKHNKFAGIHNATLEYGEKMLKLGFDFISVSSDANFIIQGANAVVSKFNNKESTKSKTY